MTVTRNVNTDLIVQKEYNTFSETLNYLDGLRNSYMAESLKLKSYIENFLTDHNLNGKVIAHDAHDEVGRLYVNFQKDILVPVMIRFISTDCELELTAVNALLSTYEPVNYFDVLEQLLKNYEEYKES
jgi:hypothetical protein